MPSSSTRSCASRPLAALLLLAACSGSDASTRATPKPDAVCEAPTAQTAQPTGLAIVSEPVVLVAQGDPLPAVVTRPQDARVKRPAVLLLADAGPRSHQGHVRRSLNLELPRAVPVYTKIAESLARRGLVVLRYDKRTCVRGAAIDCTLAPDLAADHRGRLADSLLADAKAAHQTLAGLKEVDPSRIVVLGHGQGAELALMLSDAKPTPRALVLLAPSAYPLDALLAHQAKQSIGLLDAAIAREGDTAQGDLYRRQRAMIDAQADQIAKLAALRQGRTDKLAPGPLLGVAESTWTGLFALHRKATARLPDVAQPVLSVVAGRDEQQPADRLERWRAQYGNRGKPTHHQLIERPQMSHELLAVGPPGRAEIDLDADLVDQVARFILSSSTPRP